MSDVTRITHISKSRKDHKCDFCTSTIPVGSSYVRNSGIWEGTGFTQAICDPCFAHIDKCDRCTDAWRDGELDFVFVMECRGLEVPR